MLHAVVSGSSRPVPAQLQHCVAARQPRRRWECRCTAPEAQAPLVNRGVERRAALLGALASVLGLQCPCAAQAAVPEALQDGFRAPLPKNSSFDKSCRMSCVLSPYICQPYGGVSRPVLRMKL